LLRGPLPDQSGWRQCLLLEHYAGSSEPFETSSQPVRQIVSVPSYKGLRCRSHTYVEYETGEREFYDLLQDPNQLVNVHLMAPSRLIAQQSDRRAARASCQGAGCRAAENAPEPRWTKDADGPMRREWSSARAVRATAASLPPRPPRTHRAAPSLSSRTG